MRFYISFFILSLCLLCRSILFAKEIAISKEWYYLPIDKSINRSIANIFDMAQDNYGFLYFSTNQGLYRYDGFHFEYLNENINYYLGGSHIRFDKQRRIFYENFDGHLYTYEQGLWKQFNRNKPVHFLFYGLFDKHLAYVQTKGIDIYDIQRNIYLRTIPYPIGYPQYTAQTAKHYYLLNQFAVAKFDDHKLIKEFRLQNIDKHLAIRHLYIHDQEVYIIPRSEYEDGIMVLDHDLNFKRKIAVKGLTGIINNVKFIDGKICILTTSGIYEYKSEDKKWTYVRTHLPGVSVTNIIKGKNGEYWISTLGKGLFLVPDPHQFVYSFEKEKINQIIPTHKGFLAGTMSGRILEINKEFTKAHIRYNSRFDSPIQYLFHSSRINELFYVSGSGFNYLINGKTYFYEKALKSVAQIDSHYYAMATSSDILLFRSKQQLKDTSTWDYLFTDREKNEDFVSLVSGKRSKSIAYDTNLQRIYFLTNVGLFYVDRYGNEYEVLQEHRSIIAERMHYADGKIFVLNFNGKLWEYHLGKFKVINTIKHPILDMDGYANELILKTTKGFELLNTRNYTTKSLKTNLQTYTINDFSFDRTGRILAISPMGITPLSEESLHTHIDLQAFQITKVLINGQVQKVKNLYKLPYDENNIQFQYAFLDFSHPNPPSFSYRVNKGDWENLPADNQTLAFHELAPGEYILDFRIDAEHLVKQIKVHIQPPFWQTWLFYLIILSLVLAIFMTYYNYKKQVLHKEIQLLAEKVKLEKELSKSIMTSVKAQMNPHFFFNALNSIQAFIYKNDNKQAISYLTKFSKLTRLILTQSDVETIRLSDEINMLKLYLDLETVRCSHAFDYIIEIQRDVDILNSCIPSMLIQPYVENCIKHGFMIMPADAHIHIKFSLQENILEVQIIDNGIGRQRAKELRPSQPYSSFSSSANQKRLEILNKAVNLEVSVNYEDIDNTNQLFKGTKVILHIPIKINYGSH